MPISNCRVCGQKFYDEPLLVYKNMPRAAQYLPTAEELSTDKGIDLEVCQCSGCGLVQLSNDPVSYYREVIRASSVSEEMRSFRHTQFSEFVEKYDLKGKKIVEIGCGRGEYLAILSEFEVNAYGLEYSAKSVEACVKKGLKVFEGYIESKTTVVDGNPFDAFILINFLEHLPDPVSFLNGIAINLSDDGMGLIEVPNFEMNHRTNQFTEFVADHLIYYTPETLVTVLSSGGFEILEMRDVWHENSICTIVKKRKRLDLSNFRNCQMRLKRDIEDFFQRHAQCSNRVAVWGAGHSSLSIIAMMNIADKVEYVIDSAEFKQNKYTPVTHIKIVPPEYLNIEPVDTVLIIAGGYSLEIINRLKSDYTNLDIVWLNNIQLIEV